MEGGRYDDDIERVGIYEVEIWDLKPERIYLLTNDTHIHFLGCLKPGAK